MTALTLFEIAQEYRHITDVLTDAGTDEQTLADTLEGELWPMEIKAQNYGFVIRNMEASAEAIKAAEQQMAARRKSIENRAEYLRERLKSAMEYAGVTKLESPHFAISIKKNPEKVEIFEEGLIPCELMNYPVAPPPSPDKAAIKAAIKSGQEIAGAKLIQGTRLEIK
jgi:hypothetical protein